jgi:hypothetical protein
MRAYFPRPSAVRLKLGFVDRLSLLHGDCKATRDAQDSSVGDPTKTDGKADVSAARRHGINAGLEASLTIFEPEIWAEFGCPFQP